MFKFFERAKEPSSYAGLAAIMLGLGEIFRIREAGDIATALQQGGEVVTTTGDPILALAVVLAGIVAIFRKG